MKRALDATRSAWPMVALALLVLRIGVSPQAYDSGELAAAAWELGASHPPGQVMHALLGHAAALFPLGSIGFRLSVFEAVCEVLAARLVLDLVLASLPDEPTWIDASAALLASVGALLAPELLRQACRVEVYGLALVLSLASVRSIVAWCDGDGRAVRRAAFFAGLAFATHPPHALFPLLLGALALGVRRTSFRGLSLAAASCVSALLVLVYIPVRAAAGASMWGDGRTLAGTLTYLSGSAYTKNLTPAREGLGQTLTDVLLTATRDSGYLAAACVLLLLGALRTRARLPSRTRVLALAPFAALAPALLTPLRESNPDSVAYLAPLVVSVLVAGTVGLLLVTRDARPALRVVALLALASPTAVAAPRAFEATESDVTALESLGFAIVDAPSPRALVVVETDFVASTWWATRVIDATRPDVAIFAAGLSTSSWHWRSLAPHPAFTGVPQRAPGGTPREAYVLGAVLTAAPKVSVYLEPSWPTAGRGALSSIYLVGGTDARPDEARATELAFYAAARLPKADHDIPGENVYRGRATLGDHDIAGEILRHAALERAIRLAERGRTGQAMRVLASATPAPVGPEIRRFRERALATPVPLVRDPEAVLTTRGDLVRFAATLADAAGRPDVAQRWLVRQVDHHDPLGLLELAWIALAHDDVPHARTLVQAFLRARPEARGLALPLESRLR